MHRFLLFENQQKLISQPPAVLQVCVLVSQVVPVGQSVSEQHCPYSAEIKKTEEEEGGAVVGNRAGCTAECTRAFPAA